MGSLKRFLLAALPFAAEAAFAQMVPPQIDVRKISKRNHSSNVAGMVGVGDCFVVLPTREITEIAEIDVMLPGPWERSAEHLAKQAAADAGANCLLPRQNYGAEEENYPVLRQYRAFLVTHVVVNIMGSFRLPVSAGAFKPFEQPAPSAGAAVPAPAALKAPVIAEKAVPHGPVWFGHVYLDSHDLVLDLSRMREKDWKAVSRDVERHFPRAEFEFLKEAYIHGETVVVDLRDRTVRHEDQKRADRPPVGRVYPLPLR